MYFMTKQHELIAGLSYVGVLVLIPIIAGETKNPFVAFHVRQGVVILFLEVLCLIGVQWFPRVGSILFLGLFLVSLIAFFLTIQGEKWNIPGISYITQLFKK